jgi:DNA invertase Pin-like site-specific DNA recombinase
MGQAFGYVRVSTETQHWGQEAQVSAIHNWYSKHRQEHNFTAPLGFFVDTAVSGSGVWDRRPKLNSLMATCKPGDVVIVTKLDRLARSARDLLNLCGMLETRDVALVSLDGAVNTSTPVGRLQRTMIAAIAEFERDLISQRTKDGLAAAKAAGVKLGRPSKIQYPWNGVVPGALRKQVLRNGQKHMAKVLKVHPSTVSRAIRRGQ